MEQEKLKEKMKKVIVLITDVDGVLTDGSLYIGNGGNEFKRFNVLDGAGIALLKAADIPLVVLSGRYSEATVARMRELGLEENLYQDGLAKIETYRKIKKRFNVDDEEVLYVGDDLVDLPVLKRVGVPVAVDNACGEVKSRAVYVTSRKGGEGALREVIELLLNAKGIFNKAFEKVTRDTYKDCNQ